MTEHDEPAADDRHALRYWRERIAEIDAARSTAEALRARIAEADAILRVARDEPPPAGSLAAMAIGITESRRDRDVRTLAKLETDAVLARVAPRRGEGTS